MNVINVAIIIPYYNEDLTPVLDRIESVYSERSCCLTVISVNNGGREYSLKRSYNYNTEFICENYFLNSPYSARNRGVECFSADWYIFLDSTCLPENGDWFSQLDFTRTDTIFAANVKYFTMANRTTIGDIYDSIVNIDNQKTITSRKVAKTACLAVSRTTFANYGLFKEGERSGGDVMWTGNCTKKGGELLFLDHWIVHKASRDTRQLLLKQYRVSKAWPALWFENKTFLKEFIKKVVFCFIPPNPKTLFSTAARRNISLTTAIKFRLIVLGLLLRFISALGVVRGLIK